MSGKSFWGVSSGAVLATAVLASCGGDIVAAVAFIGSAGGSWQEDENATQAGLQQRFACDWDVNGRGIAGTDGCFINIQPADPPRHLFEAAFDVTYTGNLPGCPAASTTGGRIDGERISLPNCFSGRYVSINESVQDGGARRMFFDFTPSLTEGVWVEIEDGDRRFKFANDSSGCEFTAANQPTVTVALIESDVSQVNGPFKSSIGSFLIAGDAGGAWSGDFDGVSGMVLRRGNQELKLERRNATPTTPCP
jgi:hypothetical protein